MTSRAPQASTIAPDQVISLSRAEKASPKGRRAAARERAPRSTPPTAMPTAVPVRGRTTTASSEAVACSEPGFRRIFIRAEHGAGSVCNRRFFPAWAWVTAAATSS